MSEPKRKGQPRVLTDKEGEVRELSLADFRRMKPVREVLPEFVEAMDALRKKVGRPKTEAPKVHIGFRLSSDVVASIRASGRGYNARVEQALRKAGFGAAPNEDESTKALRRAAGAKKAKMAKKAAPSGSRTRNGPSKQSA